MPVYIGDDGKVIDKTAQVQFQVSVSSNGGQFTIYENERAKEEVRRILPEGIRQYFFFDGEQLNTYFQEAQGDRIKEAVYSISQIDIFTRMIERLRKVVVDKRREASRHTPVSADYSEKLEKVEQLINGCDNFISKTQSEIAQLEQQITSINDQLRDAPNVSDLEKQREELVLENNQVAQERRAVYGDYFRFVRERSIDFSFFSVACNTLKTIHDLEGKGQLPPAIDNSLLQEMLETGSCKLCGHKLDEEDRKRIEDMLDQFNVGSETSNILSSMRSELNRVVSNVRGYPGARKRMIMRLDSVDKRAKVIEDKIGKLDERISKYANTKDNIKALYEAREQYQNEKDTKHQEIGTRKNNKAKAQAEKARLEQRLNAALRSNEKAARLNEMVAFGSAALDVLGKAEKAIVDETRIEMERRTEELFRGLVWKDSKCDHISLSENYQLSLFDKAGYSCAGTCSAAERSLLALSFTLAMHEVSGFDSPLFIDTPIARASGENRENFAKTLVGVSETKQLILAFTPDEYSESIANAFEPALAEFIKLRLSDDESRVIAEVDNRAQNK